MKSEWAIGELQRFLQLLAYRNAPGLYAASYVGSDDEIQAQMIVAERIWEMVIGLRPAAAPDGLDPYRPVRD